MKLKYQFMIQKVGDSYMAVEATGSVSEFKGIIKLNETGKFIFENLKEETTLESLIEKVAKEFDGDKEEIASSVTDYCAALKDKGLIIGD